jgi:hypothetical protein
MPDTKPSTVTSATRLLWTGGWDSTFRLLQLLLVERRCVQPFYVIDRAQHRPGVPAERRAMSLIREWLTGLYPDAAAGLHPTYECPFEEIAPNQRITACFEQSLEYGFIGGQYEWLARFCAQHAIDDVELAIHRDDRARELIADLIDASRTRVDPRFAGEGRYELFKCFRFPLYDKTKLEMRDEARRAGFEEIMAYTWFCHRPIDGEPCGVCNPCIYTIEEGLGDRIPARSMRRYRLRVLPRLRRALTRNTALYLGARSIYRRLRG